MSTKKSKDTTGKETPKMSVTEIVVEAACITAGFNASALNDETKNQLKNLAETLNELGKKFSPCVLSTITKQLVVSGSYSVKIVSAPDKEKKETK